MNEQVSSPSDIPRTWSRPGILAAAGLIAAAAVVTYLPSLRGGFLWDDEKHVTEPQLRSAHGLYRIWFDVGATVQHYPLLHTAFWVQHKLWGDKAFGYRAFSLTLHIVAAWLVMAIVRRLLFEKRVAWADPAAFLTAAVFALHPVHVESVAWITEQKNTLSGVLYLAAMLVYLRFDRTRGLGGYALATVLFALSLLAKPVTVTLPAALLVIFWWQRGRLLWRRDAAPLLPWFALSLASGLFTAWVEHEVVGAKGEEFQLTIAQRLLLPGRVVGFYLTKLLWPGELIFVYPRWTVDAAVWWQWLFPLGLAVLFIVLAVVARRNRSPLAAALFFIGSLFPVMGFFNVYYFLFSFVSDHFQYLPSLSVIALVCGAVAARVSDNPRRAARAGLLLALPLVLGLRTYQQCKVYSDIQVLYRTTLRGNPQCWMIHNNLGVVLDERGRPEEAVDFYRRALQLHPDYPDAHNNLGAVLKELGRYGEAAVAHEKAVQLKPQFPEAHLNLGIAYQALGQPEKAIEHCRQALKMRPFYPEAHNQLGMVLNAAGRHDEAIAEYEEALRLRPQYSEAYGNLIAALIDVKLVLDAIDRAHEAVRRFPDNAPIRVNLGIALTLAGRPKKALVEFEEAVRLRPDLFEAQANLAVSYESAGRFREAIAAGERALNIARSQGEPGRIAQIEAWLKACRARSGA